MTTHVHGVDQLHRVAVAAVVVLAGVLVSPGAAAAHGSQPAPDAVYYRSALSVVEPASAGIAIRVDPGGDWIELATTGPAEVVVLGYLREPYLRIKAGLVEENQLSQTTYLNHSLFADSLPSSQGSADQGPSWKQIGSKGTVRWHDHRIHWMGATRPPAVQSDPGRPHLVGEWTMHATTAGVPFEIRGTLSWLGRPSNPSWLPQWLLWVLEAGAAAAFIGVLLPVALARRPESARPNGWPLRIRPVPAIATR